MTKNFFEAITLGWNGREYTIPANKVFGAIECIEDAVTMVELARAAEKQTMPVARLCRAYANVLTYAGAPGVSPDAVYSAMMSGGDSSEAMTTAITTLLGMMTPPAHLVDPKAPKKSQPGAGRRSKRSIKPQSAIAG